MASCEKCWEDAKALSRITGKDHLNEYLNILEQRKENPCNEKEQAGQFWDEVNQIDKRKLNKKSCDEACSPSDFHKGGKCDRYGCYNQSL